MSASTPCASTATPPARRRWPGTSAPPWSGPGSGCGRSGRTSELGAGDAPAGKAEGGQGPEHREAGQQGKAGPEAAAHVPQRPDADRPQHGDPVADGEQKAGNAAGIAVLG